MILKIVRVQVDSDFVSTELNDPLELSLAEMWSPILEKGQN